MADAQSHVGVERGGGLVARFGETVVLVAGSDDYRGGSDEVLACVEAAAGGPEPAGAGVAGAVG
ncbi:MAG: hypothetical protein ACRDY0_04105, partial [Acidimicrobiales bacterium]